MKAESPEYELPASVFRPGGRRHRERLPFEQPLQIAPYDGINPPQKWEFLEVQGKDLSSSGLAFYSPDPPPSELLVVALGDDGVPIYVTARVAHTRQGFFDRRQQYVVGCQFLGRLTKSEH